MLQTLCSLLPKTTFLKSSVLLILIISFNSLPRPGPRRLINLCGRTCYLSRRHLSGCPVDPSSAPSRHQ